MSHTVRGRLIVGWSVGFLVSVLGLTASYAWDLPPGAAVVAAFGAVLGTIAGGRAFIALAHRARQEGPRALAGVGAVLAAASAVAGAFLAVAPRADHPWLDALESVAPPLRTAFLTTHERSVFRDAQAAIVRGAAELERLRTLEADVQFGARAITAEQRERLRQFLAGRGEIVAGDRLMLLTLRRHARHRQRFVLGVPLALGGAAAAIALGRVAARDARAR